MKTLLKKSIFAALFSGCFTLSAQDTNQDYTTVKDASFTLTAIVQTVDGGTRKVRITSKDIIAALNATDAFDFGSSAKLLLRSVHSALPYFVVRDSGTNEVDVSNFLTVTDQDDAVHGHNSMVNWSIWDVTLSGGGPMDFEFWGLTTLHSGAISTGGGGTLQRAVKIESVGSGPGHVNGANAQFTGKVTADHARID
jgi:hypothetical protein